MVVGNISMKIASFLYRLRILLELIFFFLKFKEIKNTMRYHFSSIRLAKVQKFDNIV